MPFYNDSMKFGDLYIKFIILMPKKLEREKLNKLENLLPKKILPEIEPTKLKYTLELFSKDK